MERLVCTNHWPFNQICIGCKYDALIDYKDDYEDEFFGRGSICFKGIDADDCPRNSLRKSEEETYKEIDAVLPLLQRIAIHSPCTMTGSINVS